MTGAEALVVGMMALAVYLPKAVPLFAMPERMPPRVRAWLEYVAPAVLAALVAPAVVAPEGELLPPSWLHSAYLATLLVALVTRRMLPSLVVGLVVLALVTLFGS